MMLNVRGQVGKLGSPERPERNTMGVRRALIAAAVICVAAAAISGTATAGHRTSAGNVTTIKAVEPPPKFKINRYVQTFTVIAQKDEPKTLQQLFTCSICQKLGKAHGADPNSNAPPKFQYLENGVGQKTAPMVNQPGDSGVTGKGKKGESIDLTVTAPAGTKLYFICLIHPWMQAVVDVT
jgi:hypothetical protein